MEHQRDLLLGEFGVWVMDGPLSSYLGKLVPAAGESSDYSTKLILNVPVGGPYRFTVNYRPIAGGGEFTSVADSPGTFTVVSSTGITVTAPTAASHCRGSSQTVSWTLTSALSGGEFRVWLVSAGGTWYVSRQVLPVAGRLSYSTTFAAGVPGGNGYRAAVYWRPTVGTGGYLVTAKSPPFLVTAVDITSPTASSRWAVNSTQAVSWTITPAATGGQFYVALVSTRGTWYINRYVPGVIDQSSYSTTFTLTGVPAGTGYTARVYWRPVAGSGAWVLSPRSAAFTVTP